jgi:MFS family permease
MKKKFLVTLALCGLGIALVLAAVRLYIPDHDPLYFYGDGEWFNTLSLILWPSVFYLAILQYEDPAKVVFVVWSIAILFNAIIYGAVGWLVWRFARFMKLVRPDELLSLRVWSCQRVSMVRGQLQSRRGSRDRPKLRGDRSPTWN